MSNENFWIDFCSKKWNTWMLEEGLESSILSPEVVLYIDEDECKVLNRLPAWEFVADIQNVMKETLRGK